MAESKAETPPPLRDISDTARWAAVHRARETERPDALFRDPFARRLAGERGEQVANQLDPENKDAWSWTARTYLFDHFITERVKSGSDTVINLAAGLDARPYRMALPASLRWVEVDLPANLDYKEQILANEKPTCRLERVRLDLSNVDARRDLFAWLGAAAKKALIISEGFLIYLSRQDVAGLARDLAAVPSFSHWLLEIPSPGLRRMLEKRWEQHLSRADAALKFAPEEGPGFFLDYGWKPVAVRSILKTAAELKRLRFVFRLLALLPESSGQQGSRPWSGVCLFERA